MNNVYFACMQCKVYIDAGYRWAYWQLEKPGVVAQGRDINVRRLLSIDSYWQPEENDQSHWLTSTLIEAKKFVLGHQTHSIVYGDMERFLGTDDDYEQFGWMNANPGNTDLQPRNFIEQMGMRSWGEVESYMGSLSQRPWWYELRRTRVIARRKFEEMVLSVGKILPRLE